MGSTTPRPAQIDAEARRVVIYEWPLSPEQYNDLYSCVQPADSSYPQDAPRTGTTLRLLKAAHGCSGALGAVCDACYDTVLLAVLEEDGWTVERPHADERDSFDDDGRLRLADREVP